MHDLDRLGQLLSKECMKTNGTSFNRGLLASGESKLSVCPPVHLNKLPALHNGTAWSIYTGTNLLLEHVHLTDQQRVSL